MGIYWDFSQGNELKNKQTKRCLEIKKKKQKQNTFNTEMGVPKYN